MPFKKSIAFVANTSWSIYKFRLYLLQELSRLGFSVFVLAPRDNYTKMFEELEGVNFIELKEFRGKSISPLQDGKLYRELLGHYRTIQPDLIIHYTIKANIYGTLAAARLGCPSISVVTGLGYTFSENRVLWMAARLLYKRAFGKNAEVWFLNSDDRRIFIQAGLTREDRSFLLPGEGVDSDRFYPAPFEPGLQPVTFLLIARIIRHKGIFEYVKAAEYLLAKGLPVRFQLLGFFDEGNPASISRDQIQDWTLRSGIEYLGHSDDVAPFIATADCIVLPSYREGLPLSLLEGGSMCKFLIASDTAGCREIVEDGINGYLCRSRDWKDLADKMEQYFNLPAADKRRMGNTGRQIILKRFTNEIISSIYQDRLKPLMPAAIHQLNPNRP